MRAWGFLRSRAMVATLGALLVFGSGATVAVSQLTHHFTSTGQANTASAATDTATTSADATATAGSGSGSGSGAGADATATTAPTATSIPPTPTTQRPTPTGGSGQPFHQTVKVASVNPSANNFTFVSGSTTYTIVVVTSGTGQHTEIQINGVAQTDLTNLKTGMTADVEGEWYNGNILAFSVDATSGGGGGGN